MAYNGLGLKIGRGVPYNSVTTDNLATHTYKSTTDTIGEITAPNYFPPYLGFDANTVMVGDYFDILDSTNNAIPYQITSLDPIQLDQKSADYERTSFTAAMQGALETPITIYAIKSGELVTLNFPDYLGTSLRAGVCSSYNFAIPARFRPSSTIYSVENGLSVAIYGVNNGSYIVATAELFPDGGFYMAATAYAEFSATGLIGTYGFSVTYQTN